MHAISRQIRDRHYQHLLETLVKEEELNESERVDVDQDWIDQRDREWQSQRALRQRLEYLRSEPADAKDVEAAQRFMRTLSSHTSEAQAVARWEETYSSRRQYLQAQVLRLEHLSERMDPQLPEHQRCCLLLESCRQHLEDLAYRIHIP